MDCFIIVARKKTQIILDLKEDTPILELKRMVGGILRLSPANMKFLYVDSSKTGKEMEDSGKEMEDNKKIYDYGINSYTTKPGQPALIGLKCREENGEWEKLEITPMHNSGSGPLPCPRFEKPSQSQ